PLWGWKRPDRQDDRAMGTVPPGVRYPPYLLRGRGLLGKTAPLLPEPFPGEAGRGRLDGLAGIHGRGGAPDFGKGLGKNPALERRKGASKNGVNPQAGTASGADP